ncbi:hypothetical protein [Rhizobium sp. SGZ-381]|uniref:hypothetical protein n=1 Tax=Rhizobium sp. SGZ-381 TaxID=3342800 RepID=UPI00366F1A76
MAGERTPILLIAAETVRDGREVVTQLGFKGAMALGHVRIVTEPHGLRGWRAGTPVLFLCAISSHGRGHACLSNEMLDALTVKTARGIGFYQGSDAMTIGLHKADPRKATSSAMSGRMDETKALAAIILWNSGHFDTFEISKVLDVGEDAVCRTLHAARTVVREGGR